MGLKPQDVAAVLFVLAHPGQVWTYALLAKSLHISVSEAHAAVRRLEGLRLWRGGLHEPAIDIDSFLAFLITSIRLVFPAKLGGLTRGMPTSYAAAPLKRLILPSKEPPPVWPLAVGRVRGSEFSPLYATAPLAALEDEKLYESLALVDALRAGRARERGLATEELQARFALQRA